MLFWKAEKFWMPNDEYIARNWTENSENLNGGDLSKVLKGVGSLRVADP